MQVANVPGKLECVWLPDVKAVWDKWSSFDITLDEIREALVKKAVPYAKAHGAIGWIADASKTKGVFTKEVKEFIEKDIFRVFSENGIRYFISVKPEDALSTLTVHFYKSKVGPHGIKLVDAETVEQARVFLRDPKNVGPAVNV